MSANKTEGLHEAPGEQELETGRGKTMKRKLSEVHGKFAGIPKPVLRDPEISSGAKLVYMAYLDRAHMKDTSLMTDVSVKDIVHDTGLCERAVRRARSELKEAGFIEVELQGRHQIGHVLLLDISARYPAVPPRERSKLPATAKSDRHKRPVTSAGKDVDVPTRRSVTPSPHRHSAISTYDPDEEQHEGLRRRKPAEGKRLHALGREAVDAWKAVIGTEVRETNGVMTNAGKAINRLRKSGWGHKEGYSGLTVSQIVQRLKRHVNGHPFPLVFHPTKEHLEAMLNGEWGGRQAPREAPLPEAKPVWEQ
jgi:hypothetical protein